MTNSSPKIVPPAPVKGGGWMGVWMVMGAISLSILVFMGMVGIAIGMGDPPRSERQASTTTTSAPADETAEGLVPSLGFVETGIGTGSAVLWEDGYAITSAHVVFPNDSVQVTTSDGNEQQVNVVAFDLATDLALIGPMDFPDGAGVEIDPIDGMADSADVFTVGFSGMPSYGDGPEVHYGNYIETQRFDSNDATFLVTDATIEPGQSGGGLFDEDGNFIGITGLGGWMGAAVAVSGEDVEEFVDDWKAGLFPNGTHLLGPPQKSFSLTFVDHWQVHTFAFATTSELQFVTVQLDPKAFPYVELVDPLGTVVQSAAVIPPVDEDDLQTALGAQDLDDIYDDISEDGQFQLLLMPNVQLYLRVGSLVSGDVFLSQIGSEDLPKPIPTVATTLSSDVDLYQVFEPAEPIQLTAGKLVKGTFQMAGDVDTYAIYLTQGQELTVALRSAPPYDMAMVIRPPDWNLPTSTWDPLDDEIDWGYDEEETIEAEVDGLYLIHVYDFDRRPGGYAISIEVD